MNKLEQTRKKGGRTLIAISIIGIAVYLGFTPLFEKIQGGVAGNVVGASFGAIFVIVLTMYLLNKQTEIEQESKRGEKIFEEKMKIYGKIFDDTELMLDDGKISKEDEMKKLPFVMARLITVGSDKVIDSFQKFYDQVNETFEKKPDDDSVVLTGEQKDLLMLSLIEFSNTCRVDLGISEYQIDKKIITKTTQAIEKSSQILVKGGDVKTKYRYESDFFGMLEKNGYDAKIIDLTKRIIERLKSEFKDKKFDINCVYKHAKSTPSISLRVAVLGKNTPQGFGSCEVKKNGLDIGCKKSPRWDYKQIKVDNLFLSHAMNFSFDEEKKEFSLQRTPDKDGTGYSKYMPALNHKALSSMTKKELDGYIVALKESVKTVEETKILPYTPLIKEAKSGDQKSIERLKEIISVSYLHELTTDEIASEAN